MKILVTGGAGFIGSHLIDSLLAEGHSVVCVDDLSLGRMANITRNFKNKKFRFVKLNVLNRRGLNGIFQKNRFDCVFHMAANSDIQKGAKFLDVDLDKTFMTTFRVLEAMRRHGVRQVVFASSSAVYGDLDKKLGEDTGPLQPVSFYGAAKLAAEAYVSACCANFGMKAWVVRFPNVIGERATHGVVHDFVNKLKKNPCELEILGDGRQKKPYLYVKDLVEGMMFVWKQSAGRFNCVNVGVETSTTVAEIAKIVVSGMGLKDVEFKYTGGESGWVGDVPRYRYSLARIKKLGWQAKRTSTEAVKLAVQAILEKGKGDRLL